MITQKLVGLEVEQIEWLNKQGNASQIIRELIDEKRLKIARELNLDTVLGDDEKEKRDALELKVNTEKANKYLEALNIEERLLVRREFRESEFYNSGMGGDPAYFKWIVKNKIKA